VRDSNLKQNSQNLVASSWSIHNWSNSIKNFEADIFTFFIAVQPQHNHVTAFSLQHIDIIQNTFAQGCVHYFYDCDKVNFMNCHHISYFTHKLRSFASFSRYATMRKFGEASFF